MYYRGETYNISVNKREGNVHHVLNFLRGVNKIALVPITWKSSVHELGDSTNLQTNLTTEKLFSATKPLLQGASQPHIYVIRTHIKVCKIHTNTPCMISVEQCSAWNNLSLGVETSRVETSYVVFELSSSVNGPSHNESRST